MNGFGLELNINMKKIVVWITGLSGSGKTTIANALYEKCIFQNKTGLLDSDVIRESLKTPLGFSIEDRSKFVNIITYMALNMIQHQRTEIVIVAMIAPLRSMRDNARDILIKYGDVNFIEVYLDTPLETCEERDVKGLYKKARSGEIKEFTGIDSPYEAPNFPEIRIHPRSTLYGEMTIDRAVDIIYNHIHEKK